MLLSSNNKVRTWYCDNVLILVIALSVVSVDTNFHICHLVRVVVILFYRFWHKCVSHLEYMTFSVHEKFIPIIHCVFDKKCWAVSSGHHERRLPLESNWRPWSSNPNEIHRRKHCNYIINNVSHISWGKIITVVANFLSSYIYVLVMFYE